MQKKVIIYAIVFILVALAGYTTGYFSEPVWDLIVSLASRSSNNHEDVPAIEEKISDEKKQSLNMDSKDKGKEPGKEKLTKFITEAEAVKSVKAISYIQEKSSRSTGYKTSFKAEQKPTSENPVWLIEVKEASANQIPSVLYFRIDAFSGKVLDFSKKELNIAGIDIQQNKQQVTKVIGSPVKNRIVYDKFLKQKLRILTYKGLEFTFDLRDAILKMSITSGEHTGPRGLRIGSDRNEVIKKFGKAQIAETDLLVYSSYDDQNIKLLINIHNDKVTSISVSRIND